MKVVAIIPARGGSVGILKKNIKLLNGKPLVAYAIETSLASCADRTIVSTDSKEIAIVSKKYGAEVVIRPKELSGSKTSSEVAILHVLESLKKQNYVPDIVVFLQCTTPLLDADTINKAVAMLSNGFDSVVSGCETFKYFWKRKDDAYFPIRPDRKMRQDMKPWFNENGGLYAAKYWVWNKTKSRYNGKIGIVLMPKENSFEIDTLFDFWLVEQILNYHSGCID